MDLTLIWTRHSCLTLVSETSVEHMSETSVKHMSETSVKHVWVGVDFHTNLDIRIRSGHCTKRGLDVLHFTCESSWVYNAAVHHDHKHTNTRTGWPPLS